MHVFSYSHTLYASICKVAGVQNSLSIKAPEQPAPSISSQPHMTSETLHSTICKRVWCQNSLSINAPERPPPCHVTHMNESCHTYEWVMSHIWMSHVTHIRRFDRERILTSLMERPPPSIAHPTHTPVPCIASQPNLYSYASHSPICKVVRGQNCLFIKALELKIRFKYVIPHFSSLHV